MVLQHFRGTRYYLLERLLKSLRYLGTYILKSTWTLGHLIHIKPLEPLHLADSQ